MPAIKVLLDPAFSEASSVPCIGAITPPGGESIPFVGETGVCADPQRDAIAVAVEFMHGDAQAGSDAKQFLNIRLVAATQMQIMSGDVDDIVLRHDLRQPCRVVRVSIVDAVKLHQLDEGMHHDSSTYRPNTSGTCIEAGTSA